jgi:hypothetical protein
MIYILNSVFTVVFYAMRWIKLDIACICFEEFINQINFFHICNRNETHEFSRVLIFFTRASLTQ